MADSFLVLGQVNSTTLGAATAGTLVTASGNGTVVSTITVCNTSSPATTFRIWVRTGGNVSTDSVATQALFYDMTLAGNDTFVAQIGATLSSSGTPENIRVQAAATGVVFVAFGVNT